MDECAQMSCAADMIGKSSTCKNGGGYFGPCPELLSLLDAMVMKRTTECESVRSNICETCPESLNAYYWCDHRFQEDMLGMYGKWSYKYYFDAFNCKTTTKILIVSNHFSNENMTNFQQACLLDKLKWALLSVEIV